MGINNLLIISFFNEFLRNIPFKKTHGIIFLATIFDIKGTQKGEIAKYEVHTWQYLCLHKYDDGHKMVDNIWHDPLLIAT
jgi:hypothetical protein